MEDDSNVHVAVDIDIPENSLREADYLMNLKSKQIPRFPSNLARFGRERDYIAPRTVAIGPYYHGVPELQEMEQLKHTVAIYFFQGLDQSREDTYNKISSIARDTRCFYHDEATLEGITDDMFAEIMFVDGCFLVQLIDSIYNGSGGVSVLSIISPYLIGLTRDMMLLENQIPWEIMEVLMPLKNLKIEDIIRLMVNPGLHGTFTNVETDEKLVVSINKDYKPSHLHCLVRFYEAACFKASAPRWSCLSGTVYTSALELAEIGIELKASQKMQFSAMEIMKGPLCAELVLAPLNLDPTIYCWLVHMVALEMWTETFMDDCCVNSYLTVLSLLMNRKEDVRELRVKGIVRGASSDKETLNFFNDLTPNLSPGIAYLRLLEGIEDYRQTRRMWIHIYRFIHNNAKTIATVLPIVSILAGIFKAILSLKQPPSAHY